MAAAVDGHCGPCALRMGAEAGVCRGLGLVAAMGLKQGVGSRAKCTNFWLWKFVSLSRL